MFYLSLSNFYPVRWLYFVEIFTYSIILMICKDKYFKMDDDEQEKLKANTWRVDDLDGGLVTGLSNLHGLGNQELMEEKPPVYNMAEVLQLQLFKEEALDSNELLQSLHSSLQESLSSDCLDGSYIQTSINDDTLQHSQLSVSSVDKISCESATKYTITLKAPTAPGRKLDEETLTWLNQGQPYEISLQCINKEKYMENSLIKSVVSIGFQERQHQYFEFVKYIEWVQNRPNDKMIELDVPMCWGVQTSSQEGMYTNQIEFQWDPCNDAAIFVKVNCLSSEFTKGKGESGVSLRLQVEIFDDSDASFKEDEPSYVAGCQVKVFRAKGANRKLKLEREKHDGLSKEEAGLLQQSLDYTIFKRLDAKDRIHKKLSNISSKAELMCGISPTQLSQLKINSNNSITSTPGFASQFPMNSLSFHTLSANSTVEETQNWLHVNRFYNYMKCFANFTGADLLRLSRTDMIQLCGPADGIRLNNALQARASRPLLTMYVSPEWHQSETGMREYHAMFLDQLTVEDLKRKLAKKCGIDKEEISVLLKQGPTGIHIHIDDEVVRNFVDEAHHVVEVLKDPLSGLSRILLK